MKEILSKTRTSPHKRLQYVYDMAKTKSICDGGDKLDKNFDQSLAEETKVQTMCTQECICNNDFIYRVEVGVVVFNQSCVRVD